MSPVIMMDQKLRQMTKPILTVFTADTISTQDTLVLCGGFEERVLAVIADVVRNGTRPSVILINYLPKYPENRSEEIVRLCLDNGLNIVTVQYDRAQPSGFGDILIAALPKDSSAVFFDVSGMSRLMIVQSIVAMWRSERGLINTRLIYASAQEYPPSEEEVRKLIDASREDPSLARLFLSSGVSEVAIVPELSALTLGANQSRLVAFPSFNTDQLVALKSELQPSRYTYIHGVPPDPRNLWRTEAIARLNWLDDTTSSDHYKNCTLDYSSTIDCLCDIYAAHGVRDRLIISPTGSKMQAVAVGLFRAFVDDVQIVYPTPRQFSSPHNYTKGIGQIFCLSLSPFGGDKMPRI